MEKCRKNKIADIKTPLVSAEDLREARRKKLEEDRVVQRAEQRSRVLITGKNITVWLIETIKIHTHTLKNNTQLLLFFIKV